CRCSSNTIRCHSPLARSDFLRNGVIAAGILLLLNNGGPQPNSSNLDRGMTDSDPRPLHLVMQLNDAVRKLLYTKQAEHHLAMPRCKERNAFPHDRSIILQSRRWQWVSDTDTTKI